MTGIRQFLKDNLLWRKILYAVLLVLYTALFLLISFSHGLLPLANQVQDSLLQHGISLSSKVHIIEITAEDLDTCGAGADVLAARIAQQLNASDVPAAIGLDLPLAGASQEAGEILLKAGKAGNLVYPVEISMGEEDRICSPLKNEEIHPGAVRRVPEEITQGYRQGHIVRLADEDGILRHATFGLTPEAEETQIPSMAQMVYQAWCERTGETAKLPEDVDAASFLIKFSGRSEVEKNTCTATEFLEGTSGTGSYKDSVVYIGVSDTRSDAGFMTAIDRSRRTHSAEADAEITNVLMTQNMAVDAPLWIQILLLAVMIWLTVFLITRFHSLFGGLCYILIYELLVQVIAMLVYGVGYSVLVFPHMVNGLLTGLVLLAAIYYNRITYSRRELEKVLGKYVDNRIAGGLIKEKRESEERTENIRQGKTQKVAVMFADIRGFTSISEKVPPEALVRMLNECLSMMSESVERYGGTVDKFIGDCLMAYWGAPEADEDPVYHACLAAAEIQRRAAESEDRMRPMIGTSVKIGIGISYGDVIVGNIGSADRMNYTVIGDTVNTAARLEGLAPGGQVYLSEEAAKQLNMSGDLEQLPQKFKLKGKEKEVAVYSLNGISVRGGGKKKESEERKLQAGFRRRAYTATLVNFCVFVLQFIFVVNSLRSYGISFVSYFTIPLSAVSCAVMVMLIPYDLKAAENADGKKIRPKWLDILMLTALTANLQSALAVLLRVLPLYGLSALHSSGSWPGGSLIYLLCPLLTLISFFVLESRSEYKLTDALPAELPLAAVLLASALVGRRAGLDQLQPELYGLFYTFPEWLLTILLELAGIVLLIMISRKLRLQEKLQLGENSLSSMLHRLRMTKAAQFLTNERNRQILAMTVNLTVAALSLRVTAKASMAGGIRVYSNPSLTGIIIGITGIIAAGMNLTAMAKKEHGSRNSLYKYLTFTRNLGCTINFFSVFLLAVSGEGLSAFFTPRWGADVTVFLLCPLLSGIAWLMEQNEYDLWKCSLTSLPYVVLLFLSKAAINTVINSPAGAASYSYEIVNFYQTSAIIVVCVAEIALTGLLYLENILAIRVLREAEREDRTVTLSICGSRFGISGGMMTESEFGLHSECYVVRDGDYGIVIGGGSGLERASACLRGCTSVDILLGSMDFRDLMGFLAAPAVCEGARLRIVAPFDMERFAVNPFWPVNLIRRICVNVPTGKPFRLNNMYSVTFTPTDTNGMHHMIRISGETEVCVTGRQPAPEGVVRKWCQNADMMIFNSWENWNRGCYIAIDNSIPGLILSGMANALPDSEILAAEQKARKLYSEAIVAREGAVFPIHRQ